MTCWSKVCEDANAYTESHQVRAGSQKRYTGHIWTCGPVLSEYDQDTSRSFSLQIKAGWGNPEWIGWDSCGLLIQGTPKFAEHQTALWKVGEMVTGTYMPFHNYCLDSDSQLRHYRDFRLDNSPVGAASSTAGYSEIPLVMLARSFRESTHWIPGAAHHLQQPKRPRTLPSVPWEGKLSRVENH